MATQSEALPDIPTVGDFLPGYEPSTWNGIGSPRNTPVEVVDRLNDEINAGLSNSKLRAQIADLGSAVLALSPVNGVVCETVCVGDSQRIFRGCR